MIDITKFLAKPKEVVIKGETFVVEPLSIKDIGVLVDLSVESKRGDAIKKLLFETLKKNFPDASDEELNGLSFEIIEPLLKAIMEVNGLDKE